MEENKGPGTYILVIKLDGAASLTIGRLGVCAFREGYYLYVGSALNGLQQRVARHLRREKRLHWHIDYLLQAGIIVDVWCHEGPERLECAWAEKLRRSGKAQPVVKGFGASDCRCWGHLFSCEERPEKGIVGECESKGRVMAG